MAYSSSFKTGKKNVLVVGGGAGGMSSALVLQNAGFQVKVLEKNPGIGGKLSADTMEGFVFDNGPSILTLPGVLRELFRLTGKSLEDYLELVPLDPQWRCFFNDGQHFDFRATEEGMLSEIGKFAPQDVDGFRKLMLKSRELYKISENNFFFQDLGNVFDVLKQVMSKESAQLAWNIQPFHTYARLVEKYIQNPRLKQALEHLPQYVGSSPFLSPAILACLIYVQFEKGCWYPMGGMNKISEALVKRFEELGGEYITDQTVDKIYDDGRTIRGVETRDGKMWTAEEYVFNIDVNCFREKLNRKPAEEKDLACSGVTVFLGLDKKVNGLAHHNFFFSESHKNEFMDLYDRRLPHQDPTIYACVPSKTDPSVAPEGKENIFLLIHSPTLNSKTDWNTYLDVYVELILNKLKKTGYDLKAHTITVQKNRSPKDIGEKWGTYKGNIYGMASHGLIKGGFKTKNSGTPFRNCQLAGGTVNPGAGVPMSLMSGMVAGSNLIQKAHSFGDLRV
jgi:diapolycopene oxygenase